mgnify:CR=1 FL=1
MSEQRNLILALVLAMTVIFGWQYLVGVPKIQEDQARQAQLAEQQKAQTPAATAQGPHGLPRAEAIAQTPDRAAIDTPTLEGTINLTGGRFDDPRGGQEQVSDRPPQASAHRGRRGS